MVNNEKPLLYEAAFLYSILHKKYRISQRGLCNVFTIYPKSFSYFIIFLLAKSRRFSVILADTCF